MKKIKVNSEKEFRVAIIFIMYPLIIYTLSILIPDDIFYRVNFLGDLIKYFSLYIPALNGLGERSKYPEIFQSLFLLQMMSVIVLFFLFNKKGYIISNEIKKNDVKKTVKGFILTVLVIAVFFFYIFIRFASEDYGSGTTRFAKVASKILFSKIYFSIYTCLFFFTLSLFIYMCVACLKALIAALINRRK